MREVFRDGEAVVERLARGVPLRSALVVADTEGWLALDAGVRQVAWNLPKQLPAWEHAAPLPADLAGLDEARLTLALCHRDGRVREAAIARAARRPELLPLIVIRCTDWVGPVRERARELLRAALHADPEGAVDLAPLILRVGRRDRGSFGIELLGEVLVGAPPGQRTGQRTGLLAELLAGPDRAVRRFACRLAVEHRLIGPAELARTAARDEDAVVQDLCATAALTSLAALPSSASLAPLDEAGSLDAVLTPLLTARAPRVRSAGVTALRRADRAEQAQTFLDDRSALVRACARYVVRQVGGDPTAWYRERCATEDTDLAPGAVIGLAECGDRSDGARLWSLLAHPAPGVRARAVAGLRTLDLADAARLAHLLDDPSPAVVRETAAALLPSARQLPVDRLLERTGPERPRHTRVAAFRLLSAHGGVVALRAAAGLLDDPDVKLRIWAGQYAQSWHASPDVRPGDAEVGTLFDRCRHLFSDYVLQRRKRAAGLDG
ncbi:hypothetical protein [Streptomyces sp. NPDC057302]|uniref:hypothetical protein n=1 Tax=Streptomyces sp. NPDC057302 TaxID=3346094 RepID=UPI003637D015